MKNSLWIILVLSVAFLGCKLVQDEQLQKEKESLPNILIIYADDMGYGDLEIQNPNAKIPTPNLNQLAREGMRFTDGHSSSGICSPSRYALLTGNYHWRRQHEIVGAFGEPFFNETDLTLPQILKTKGYVTAVIGKWHLGWNWDLKKDPAGQVNQWGKERSYYLPNEVTWDQPITGGPLDRGFDYYFGDGTINFPPYAWVENDRVLTVPTQTMHVDSVGYTVKEGTWEFRAGPKEKDWNPYDVLPTLADKAVAYINQQTKDTPFFFYFSLPSPHAPIIPNDAFDGTSKAGAYGDFMVQTDHIVGRVLKALKAKSLEGNTIVIFSSDNGPEHYAWNRAVDHDHYSMGTFRGLKRDVWEGGHHVPFIVKWPGQIAPGSVSDETIHQVDIMASLARITGIELPSEAAVDSYDFTPVWLGKKYEYPLREATVHNTYATIYGLRKGDWLYLNNSTGGHRVPDKEFNDLPQRQYVPFKTEGLLFNMKEDPQQRINLYQEHPDIVKDLRTILKNYRQQGFSVNRKKEKT